MAAPVLLVFSTLCFLLAFLCFFRVLAHAFSLGFGPALFVLLIPTYGIFYAFRHFEHRHKNWFVAGWLVLTLVGITLRWFALTHLRAGMN